MSAKDTYGTNLLNWSDIQGHLPRLYEAAHGNCLEIGVRGGMSTSALLAGIEENGGFLYSVDVNDCPVFKDHPQWQFIRANSIEERHKILDRLPNVLDVVFIDGDHSYEGCLSDLYTFAERALHVFVHDTSAPDYPGVRQAVEEYVKGANRELQLHEGSFGMAEIK